METWNICVRRGTAAAAGFASCRVDDGGSVGMEVV